jgi:predicted ATPase
MLASRVVGRDVEIAVLDEALEQATGGRGGVVFLVGEPGIGKSRCQRSLNLDPVWFSES